MLSLASPPEEKGGPWHGNPQQSLGQLGSAPPHPAASGGSGWGPGTSLSGPGPDAGTATAQPPLGCSVTRTPGFCCLLDTCARASTLAQVCTHGAVSPAARQGYASLLRPGAVCLSVSWEEEPARGLCEPHHTPGLAACPTHLAWHTRSPPGPGALSHVLSVACPVAAPLLRPGRVGLNSPTTEVLICRRRCVRHGLAFPGGRARAANTAPSH